MKDSLIITAKASGAEVIPFIKVWVLLPMALLVTFLFTRLSNRLKREHVFYIMLSLFLGFFFIFTFVIYPIRNHIHPHATAEHLQTVLPLGFKGLIAMFRYWSFTAFYVLSELWGSAIFSVLFWGFANEVTKVTEAKRFYGLLGIGANFSGIASGQISILLCPSSFNPRLPFGHDAWEQSLIFSTIAILISGVLVMFMFRWFNSKVLKETAPKETGDKKKDRANRPKMSMRQNFSYLAKSKYLISIAVVVLSYNIVINLTEVVWKDQVRRLYPNPSEYFTYMGQITTITGILATLTAVFISGNSLRKCGWTFTAMIPPFILLSTSIGFFSFLLFQDPLGGFVALLGSTPLALVVFFGSAQNCLSRASKYTLFDATKELSFIPLDRESKLKGKAAIDGVGSRLGKSGGSVIHQGLLMFFGTVAASAPYVGGFLLVVISLWMVAVKALGRRFSELIVHHETLQIKEEERTVAAPVGATPVATPTPVNVEEVAVTR